MPARIQRSPSPAPAVAGGKSRSGGPGPGRRMRASVKAAAAALVAGLALAACGGQVIDNDGAERFIDEDLSSAGVEVSSVDCPVGVEVEAGERFECEVVDDSDEVAVVTMEIVSDEGRVRPVSIDLAESGAASGEGAAPGEGTTPGEGGRGASDL